MGFLLNFALEKILAAPGGKLFSNFSYVLYGLVTGGKGWGQVLIDHPEAYEGSQIYVLAFEVFRANPMGLVVGSLKMWRQYFQPNIYHAFAFMRYDAYEVPIQIACYGLSGLGFVKSVHLRREPHYILLVAATVGHLASISFAPAIDAGLRVYAATMPILAILVAIGVGWIVQTAVRELTGLGNLFKR